MTVPTTVNRTVFLGAGIAGPFGTNFPFILNADVKVIKTLIATGVATALAEGPDYTLVQDPVTLQGTVTLAVAIDATYKLTIYRDPAATQNTQWPPNDKFPAKVTENAIDRLTMLIQRFTDLFSRGARLPDSDISGADPTLPTPVAGSVLGWSATGLALQNYVQAGVFAISGFGQTLINAATAAAARALLLASAGGDTIFTTATAYGAGIVTAANAAASRIVLGFSAIAAKGDLFVGTAAAAIGTLTVGVEGAGLLADPAQAAGMQWVRLGAGSVRQSVLSAKLDANGYNAAITTGAGLRPGLAATGAPFVVTFAAGFGAGGSLDLVSTLTADVADPLGADAKLNNTTFMHATWASLSSVTWGQCLVPPQHGYAFDRTKQALLNFEAADQSTIFLDDFGNTWARGASNTAKIVTAQFKFGASSLLLDGAANSYIESTNFVTLGDGSWEASFAFRLNAAPGVGANMDFLNFTNAAGFGLKVRLSNTAGVIKLAWFISSDSTSENVANGTLGANTVWALNQWNKLRIQFDALSGNYRAFLSLNAAAETTDITTASTAKVCAITSLRVGADKAGTGGMNGWIDAFRFLPCATNTAAENPSGAAPAIGDLPVHFVSIPEMKMYEVTAASGAAGVNPTLTQRNRVFNAEFDTSGAAVTAVRNYALRGQWEGIITQAAAASTKYTYNHNLGIIPRQQKIAAICRTIDSGIFVPGDESALETFYYEDTNANNIGAGTRHTRNSSFTQLGNAGIFGFPDAAGLRAAGTATRWAIRATLNRGW